MDGMHRPYDETERDDRWQYGMDGPRTTTPYYEVQSNAPARTYHEEATYKK
jgi:hypothetical protein